MKKLSALVCAAVIMLSGCAKAEGEPDSLSETAPVSEAPTEEAAGEAEDIIAPAHDYDPEAMAHRGDGRPYFLSDELKEVTFYPDTKAVKRCGRFIEYNEIYYLSYTCSSVDFIMTGDRLEATFASNGNVYADNQQGWIGVLINGKMEKRIQLDGGELTYLLYEGEELENAEISIVKLSENQMATTGIVSITANARKIAPKSEKKIKIEFVGDSITCGYGNEAFSPDDGYDSAQQNGIETYGYYTAQALDADCEIAAISGIGLVSDYTSTRGVREDYLLVDDMYTYSDSNFQMRRGIEELTPWDFGEGSDIVVINIGTNDYSYTGKDEDLQQEFLEAYGDFLGKVRSNNPDAKIVCTLGVMGAELFPKIEEAAAQYIAETGDENVYTLKLDYQDEEDGFGGDYHPTIKTHRKIADQLVDFLKTIM